MAEYYIKCFFLIFCGVCLFKKLLDIHNSTRFGPWIDVFFSLLLSILACAFDNYFQPFRSVVITLSISGFTMLYYCQTFKIAVVTSIISVGLSYLFGVLGAALTFLVKYSVLGVTPDLTVIDLTFAAATGIFQLLLIMLMFSFRRLRKGMPFLKNERFADIGVIISLVVIIGTVFWTSNVTLTYLGVVLTCGAVIFLWWLNQLQVNYRQRHSAQVEESLEQEITKLREENAGLVKKNYELSRRIHKDNKAIPALELAYREMLAAAQFENEEKQQTAYATLDFIASLSARREDELEQYDIAHKKPADTGVPAVDTIVRYMAQRAVLQGVRFEFSVMGSVKYLADRIIPAAALSTLLADLLENALIAVKDAVSKNIFLSIGIVENAYILAVYDSGAAFSPEIVRCMGLERATTHALEGGSGIGLMTALEIIHDCKASFVIDETLDNSLYTKAVSVCFDGLDRIRVRSDREEILALGRERDDIDFIRTPVLISID